MSKMILGVAIGAAEAITRSARLTVITSVALTISLFGGILTPSSAEAGPIETFSFAQTGYVLTDTLSGTFSGALEPGGSIQLADLTAFSAAFTANLGSLVGTEVDTYSLADLNLFSFFPSTDGPNSSLDIFASITTGVPGSICVGAAAAFGLCGQEGNAVGVDHLRYSQNPFLFETTAQFANVAFVPQTAAVPEPAYLGICGVLLAFLARRRRAMR